MSYYGIYQFFINDDYVEMDILIGIAKAENSDDAIYNYLVGNVPAGYRNFVKGYLHIIECGRKAYYVAKNSGYIERNKERLGIWNFNK